MTLKPAAPESRKRSLVPRLTAVFIVAVASACATGARPPDFPPFTLNGPNTSNDCTKMAPQGQCPFCAHCVWTASTHTCTVDNYAATTCECYQGQATSCPSGPSTCHIIDRTHSTDC